MQTTDFIATLALVTSVVSLTYTVVVDRRRPKLRVSTSFIHIFDRRPDGVVQHGPYFSVSATNHGPGRILVQGVALASGPQMKRKLKKLLLGASETQAAILDSLPESPDRLPRWLEVGESLTLLYPQDSEIATQTEFDRLYLWDSIGKQHYAPKESLLEARKGPTSQNDI